MDTLTSLSWYFSNTLPAIFFTIAMHYSEMERCWGSRFFSSMCCILLIQIFFIARKLLTNVNKQLNKAIGPSSLTAKCSQWRKGKPSVRAGFFYIAESLTQNRKKCCAPQRFYITKAQIHIIHISEQCPLVPAAAAGTQQNQAVLC